MSANPLPNPSLQPKKPIGRAKRGEAAKCKPRTWQEIDAAIRGGGWYRCKNADLADKIRLTSGNVCSLLLDLIFQNIGRQWSGKGDESNETTPMVVEDLATSLKVTTHAINETLAYLSKRKMATIIRQGGLVVVALHTERWASIADDYETWKAKQPKPAPTEEEATDDAVDDPVAVKHGVVPITRKPERVGAGCKSRAYPIKTGVKDYELDLSESPIDIEMSAAVISGRFVVKCVGQLDNAPKSNQHANRTKSTGYGGSSGSVDPEKGKNGPLPPQADKRNTTNVASKHPRADELAKLFDPLIFQHCKQTLSGDPSFHLQACEAIADTPHDDLVKAAVERGSRMLRPGHVPSVCRQIHHDWEKGKGMPAGKKLPTREEIDAMAAREKQELADARAKIQREEAEFRRRRRQA